MTITRQETLEGAPTFKKVEVELPGEGSRSWTRDEVIKALLEKTYHDYDLPDPIDVLAMNIVYQGYKRVYVTLIVRFG